MFLLVLISFKIFAVSGEIFQVNITKLNNRCAHSSNLNESVSLSGKPFVIVVHGWLQSASVDFFQIIAAKLNAAGQNVLLVDYREIASTFWYPKINTTFVGCCLAEFLQPIFNNSRPSFIHGIGFSLGPHVLGVTCRKLRELKRCDKITALEPAGPGYGKTNKNRLDKTDASTVVQLKTNAGLFGNKDDLGTCIFVVNNGYHQPFCPFVIETIWMRIIFCSHTRAMYIFIESLDGKTKFVGCSKTGNLTFNADIPIGSTGKYWFKTNFKSPYALGNTKCHYK